MDSAASSHGEPPAAGVSAPEGKPQRIDAVLAETASALAELPRPAEDPVRRAERFAFREFAVTGPHAQGTIGTTEDQELELKIELGRTQVCSDDLVELRRGSVVSLDKSTSEPADIVCDGQIVARGEVLVLDGKFCVRVTELVNLVAQSKAA